jgi:signal transduction histidine kinase
MKKNVLVAGLMGVALIGSTLSGLAQQFGTAVEARAMLDRAVAELKSNEAAALGKFNDKENKQFRDRDLYVFCFNVSDGKFTAHPNPTIMGTDVRALKAKDDPLGQRLFDQVKEGAVTTVDYNFPKPGTTEPVPKESYIIRIGGQGCGVGYYK